MDTASGSSLMMLIGVVFILIGLIFVPLSIKKLNADRASRAWPQATATLERAEVMKYVVDRMHKDEGPTTRTRYSAALEYVYEVNGQRHVAQHGEPADDAAHAARLVAAHTLGETRSIHYHPQAPQEYRVELAAPYSGLLWLLPGLAFAGFGWLIIWAGKQP